MFVPHNATSAARTTGVTTGGDPVTMKREVAFEEAPGSNVQVHRLFVAREVDIGPMARQVPTRRPRAPPSPALPVFGWSPQPQDHTLQIAHSPLGRAVTARTSSRVE